MKENRRPIASISLEPIGSPTGTANPESRGDVGRARRLVFWGRPGATIGLGPGLAARRMTRSARERNMLGQFSILRCGGLPAQDVCVAAERDGSAVQPSRLGLRVRVCLAGASKWKGSTQGTGGLNQGLELPVLE